MKWLRYPVQLWLLLLILAIMVGKDNGIAAQSFVDEEVESQKPEASTPETTPLSTLRYNQVRQKNAHNSYERREGIMDQLIYHLVRSIEYDLHPIPSRPGQFGVFHDAGYLQTYSSFATLNDGVKLLEEFNLRLPRHHVVTIFFDLKHGLDPTAEVDEETNTTIFTGSHTPQDLDDTIGRLPLWTPADAKRNESTIADGIKRYGWPTLEELRGKFIFVATSGQDEYCKTDRDCNQRKAFVSRSSIETEEEIGATSYSVFYNQKSRDVDDILGPKIYEYGHISRVWDAKDINNADKWNRAKNNKFHHITTDRVNFHRDTFSRTHNAKGYPFESLEDIDTSAWENDEQDENHTVMYIYADTGDTWGRKDNGNFVYRSFANDTEFMENYVGKWVEFKTTIAMVNSHCESLAKAGLMIRAAPREDTPDTSAPYFAVGRTCELLARVQYRPYYYLFSVATPLLASKNDVFGDSLDGIEDAKRVTVKIRYKYDGQNSTAEGYIKLEGPSDNPSDYHLIDRVEFPNVFLSFQGIFSSSRNWAGNEDGTHFKTLFLDTKFNGENVVADSFTGRIGRGGNYFSFGDGFFEPGEESKQTKRKRNLRERSFGG